MTIISLIAFVLSILAMGLARSQLNVGRLPILGLLLIVHLAACVYYYFFSLGNITDASGYYFDPYHFSSQPFSFGSAAVYKICAILKRQFGATYLDCFMLFQTFGFAGLVILFRTLGEIQDKLMVSNSRGTMVMLFLPSVNFWTSAIGKDAPLFFCISLALWSMLKIRTRFFYFCLSLGVMVIFRAHIALIAVTALAASAFFDRSMTTPAKLALLTISVAGVVIVGGAVQSAFGVDVSSIDSMTQFLDQQNAQFATIGGTTSLGNASYATRAISLLFRPFFFDAQGMLGLVASIENIGVIVAFLYIAIHLRDFVELARRILFIRFAIILAFLLLLTLTLVYYNVGLGLRERVMAYPPVFSILVALWSMARQRSTHPALRTVSAPRIDVEPHRALPEA